MSAEIVQFLSRAERELLRVYRSLPEHRRGIFLEAVTRMADGEPPEDVAVWAFVQLGDSPALAGQKIKEALLTRKKSD